MRDFLRRPISFDAVANYGSRCGLIGLAIAFSMLSPTPAMAEVADKEPTSAFLWLLSAAFVISAWILSHFRWWLAFALWPFSVAWAIVLLLELQDIHVGSAILAELGSGYALQAYLNIAVGVLASPLIALWARRRRDFKASGLT